mmetsp:Transcript_39698/g.86665  ORF Transcript_39698/g.86665 Transcript_39698/m.86665 type:complete len:98 (-) Transcript_39698:16-309(-)
MIIGLPMTADLPMTGGLPMTVGLLMIAVEVSGHTVASSSHYLMICRCAPKGGRLLMNVVGNLKINAIVKEVVVISSGVLAAVLLVRSLGATAGRVVR